MGFARPEAFTAAVFGGIGNLGGVVRQDFAGLIESIGAGYIGPLTGGVPVSIPIFCFIVLILCSRCGLPACAGERGGPA
jgi:branched-chain amino acid transport system permease protein